MITKLIELLYQSFKNYPIEVSAAYNTQKLQIIGRTIEENLILIIIFILIISWVIKYKKSWFTRTIILLTIIDLFLFSKGNLITFPIKLISKKLPVAEWLTDHLNFERYYSTSGNIAFTGLGVYWSNLRAREPFSANKLTDKELIEFTRFKQELEALPENQGMNSRIFDVSGYAAVVPQTYAQFWQENSLIPNSILIGNPSNIKLDVVGAKYFVTGYPNDFIKSLEEKKLNSVFEVNNIKVYQNHQAWPRTFIISGDERIPAKIVTYKPNYISIESKSEKKAKLVLTDTFYPGWKAKIDGKLTPISKYQNTFRMVDVPQGTHKVEFIFKPNSVIFGAIISLSTVLVIVLLLWQRKLR